MARLKVILSLVAAAASLTLMISTVVAGDHSWISGMAGTCAYVSTGWHSEVGGFIALDLRRDHSSCPGTTAGTPVYYQDYGYNNDLRVKLRNYSITTQCTGVKADLFDWDAGYYVGTINYVHLNVAQGVFGAEFYSGWGWNIFYLGDIAGSQPNCSWSGPHLHQSGPSQNGPWWTNWGLPGTGGTISPTGNVCCN
jgi:hypothetical protein